MGSEPTSSWFSLLLQQMVSLAIGRLFCLQCSSTRVLKWLVPSPPPGPSSKSPLHRSSLAIPSKQPLYYPPSAPEGSLDTGMSTAHRWNLGELVAGAQLNWNPACRLWDHSPVSLSPRGQCSLSPDHQVQKDSGGHWNLAPSNAAAAPSRRAQADCAQTLTWSPGRNKEILVQRESFSTGFT